MRSSLRKDPKYKVCEKKVQRHLSDCREQTFMSEDLDIDDSERSEGGEASRSSEAPPRNKVVGRQLPPPPPRKGGGSRRASASAPPARRRRSKNNSPNGRPTATPCDGAFHRSSSVPGRRAPDSPSSLQKKGGGGPVTVAPSYGTASTRSSTVTGESRGKSDYVRPRYHAPTRSRSGSASPRSRPPSLPPPPPRPLLALTEGARSSVAKKDAPDLGVDLKASIHSEGEESLVGSILEEVKDLLGNLRGDVTGVLSDGSSKGIPAEALSDHSSTGHGSSSKQSQGKMSGYEDVFSGLEEAYKASAVRGSEDDASVVGSILSEVQSLLGDLKESDACSENNESSKKSQTMIERERRHTEERRLHEMLRHTDEEALYDSVFSEDVVSSDCLPTNRSPHKEKKKRERPHKKLKHGHVRSMLHTDQDENQGWYTGKINKRFQPHDKHGIFLFGRDGEANNYLKEGEWANGKWLGGRGSPDGDTPSNGEAVFLHGLTVAYSARQTGDGGEEDANNDGGGSAQTSLLHSSGDAGEPFVPDGGHDGDDEADSAPSDRTCHKRQRRRLMGRRPGRSATAAVVALIVTPFLMFCVIYAMNSLLSQQESVPTTETPEHEIPKQTSGEQGKEEDATINVSMADESSPTLQLNTGMAREGTLAKAPTSLETASGDELRVGLGKTFGIMFDVETAPDLSSASSLIISGMDLYIADTTVPTHYEIWTKPGSWRNGDSHNNAGNVIPPAGAPTARLAAEYLSGFLPVANGAIRRTGHGNFTEVSFQELEIVGGRTRQAFWVTLSDNLLLFKSRGQGGGFDTNHEVPETAVQSSNGELLVYYGMAVRTYPLELADPVSDFSNGAGFLGRIWMKTL